MKNLKYIAILALSVLAVSCNLDQFPESEQAKKDVVTDAAGLEKLMIGTYSSLHRLMEYEWAVAELRGDNSRLRAMGSSSSETIIVRDLDYNNAQSSNKYMQNYWDAAFVTIYRCNDILANLGVVGDEALRARYEGEALFLRANTYFNLVRLWGPMFLVERVMSVEDYRLAQRSSVDDTYTMIMRDLEKIVNDKILPAKWDDANLGRVTLTAAKSILAKVYMTYYEVGSAGYLKAKPLLESVLADAGNPALATDLVAYDKIFDITNEMNKEIIFAVRYMTGSKGVGSPFGNMFAPSSSKDGVVINGATLSLNYPTSDIINAFNENPGDKRKDVSLREGFFDKNGTWIVSDGESRYVNKYMSKPDNGYDSENDWPVIRVGDMILLYAELLNETGDVAGAMKYVNLIRGRAGIPAYKAGDFSSKYDFRPAIKKERRLELAFENQRVYDLLRWGDMIEVMNNYYQVETNQKDPPTQFYANEMPSMKEFALKLPIPITVMNVNGEVSQNPGY